MEFIVNSLLENDEKNLTTGFFWINKTIFQALFLTSPVAMATAHAAKMRE